jgi:hypothetical protein
MIQFLKSNIFSALLLLGSGVLFIYNLYNNFHKPKVITSTKVDSIIKLDSIKSVIEQDYRYKIDSISNIYNQKLKKLESKDRELNEKLKNLNNDIGDLPDFN